MDNEFLTVNEGVPASYEMRLNSNPGTNGQQVIVTISYDATDSTGTGSLTFAPRSLTFFGDAADGTPGNWNTNQAVNVTNVPDADDVSLMGRLVHTATAGYLGGNPQNLSFTVQDTTVPTAPSNLRHMALTGRELRFLWDAPSNVDDVDVLNYEVAVRYAGSQDFVLVATTEPSVREYIFAAPTGLSPNAYRVRALGNNGASLWREAEIPTIDFVLSFIDVPATNTYIATEGGANAIVRVGLSRSPQQPVIVTVDVDVNNRERSRRFAGGLPAFLTFMGSELEQSFTVTALDDNDIDSDSVSIGFLTPLPGGVVVAEPSTVNLRIQDSSVAGIALSEQVLNINEGEEGTYSVSLNTRPDANVTVGVSSGDTEAVTVRSASSVPLPLIFTNQNWDTGQSVIVSAEQDGDIRDETVQISHTASGATGYDQTLDISLTVNVTDSDLPTVSLLPPESLTLDEGEGEGVTGESMEVVARVDFAVGRQFTVPVVVVGGSPSVTDADYTVSHQTLSFDGSLDGETQTFTVSVVNDDLTNDFGVESFEISLGSVEGVNIANTVTITVTIIESVAVSFVQDFVDILEARADYFNRAELNRRPGRQVIGRIGAADESTATLGSDYIGLPASFTFSASQTLIELPPITFLPDEVAEDGIERLIVEFSDTGGARHIGLGVTIIEIEDDDFTLITDLAVPPSVTVTEEGMMTYTVRLNRQPSETFTLRTQILPETLTNILAVSPGQLLFGTGNWNDPQAVTVRALDDADVLNVTATLTHILRSIDSPSARPALTNSQVQLFVDDNDEAVLSISGDATVSEGGTATVLVSLDTAVGSAFTVEVTTGVDTDDTAIAGEDYMTGSQTLSFAGTANEVQTFTVETTPDGIDESDETFTVSFVGDGLISLATADINTVATRTITITEPVQLGIVAAGEVPEGQSATVSVTVDRVFGSAFTVEVTTGVDTDDTATAGVDYIAVSQTLSFAGTEADEVQTFTVNTVDDDIAEFNETFSVAVTTDAPINLPPDFQVEITDDEEKRIVIEPATLTLTEGSGTGVYEVTLSTVPQSDVVTSLTFSPDILALTRNGSPFTPLLFTPSTWNIPQQITVAALEDGNTSDDTIDIIHELGGSGYGSFTGTLPVLVRDSSVNAILTLSEDLTVQEGQIATVSVALDRDFPRMFTVELGIRFGTASEGAGDYSPTTNTTLTFAGRAEVRTFTVQTIDNDIAENPETFTVNVGEPRRLDGIVESGVTVPRSQVVVTIEDNETATLSVSSETVPEGDVVTVTVSLDTPIQDANNTFTATLDFAPSSDYTTAAQTLTFTDTNAADNAVGAQMRTITVQTNQDVFAEGDETFVVTASVSGNDTSLTIEDGSITITDDEVAAVSFNPLSLTFAELTVRGSYTIGLDSQPETDVIVNISVTGGDSDELIVETPSLTFPATDWNTPLLVNVRAVADSTADRETFVLTQQFSGGGYTFARDYTVVVTDPVVADGSLTVSDSNLNFVEGETATVTVTLDNSVGSQFTVAINTGVGTAVRGDDYTAPDILTFEANTANQTQTFTVTAIDDDFVESDETFSLLFGNITAISGSSVNIATAGVRIMGTIEDNDIAGIDVPQNLTVTEGMVMSYAVALNSQPTENVAVDLSAQPVSGIRAASLMFDSGAALFFTPDNWNTPQTVIVSAPQEADPAFATDNDNILDGMATITHTAAGYVDGDTTLNVLVSDDEMVQLAVLTGGETTGGVRFPFQITEGEPLTYQIRVFSIVSFGTPASVGGKFTVETIQTNFADTQATENEIETLTFDGTLEDTEKILTLRTIDDEIVQTRSISSVVSGLDLTTLQSTELSDRELARINPVAARPVQGGEIVNTVSTAGQVVDNDIATLTIGDVQVEEGQPATVSVSLGTTGTGFGFIVRLSTEDSSSASFSSDYTAVTAQMLTFDGNINEVETFTVQTTTDNTPEGLETFVLRFDDVLSTQPTNSELNPVGIPSDGTTLRLRANAFSRIEEGGSGIGDGDRLAGMGTVTIRDIPEITVSETTLEITESMSETYTVMLVSDSLGGNPVTITPVSTSNKITFSPASFTLTNSNAPQTVTVTAVDDSDSDDESAEITHTAQVGDFSYPAPELPSSITVTITDDDAVVVGAGIALLPASLTVSETGSASYDVSLSVAPSGQVDVAIDVGLLGGTLTFTPTALVFNESTWNVVQAVTVEAAAGADDGSGSPLLIRHTAIGGGYNVEESLSLTVLPQPGDVRRFRSTPLGRRIALTWEAPLNADGAAVTGYELQRRGIDETEYGNSRTFPPDATSAQHIFRRGNSPASVFRIRALAAGVVGEWVETVSPGALLSVNTLLEIEEGDTASYTVVLRAEPTAPVTVVISSNNDDVTATGLTFAVSGPNNWNTPQEVTVTAAQDDDILDDEGISLNHVFNGGGYDSVRARVDVRVDDDDEAVLN